MSTSAEAELALKEILLRRHDKALAPNRILKCGLIESYDSSLDRQPLEDNDVKSFLIRLCARTSIELSFAEEV